MSLLRTKYVPFCLASAAVGALVMFQNRAPRQLQVFSRSSCQTRMMEYSTRDTHQQLCRKLRETFPESSLSRVTYSYLGEDDYDDLTYPQLVAQQYPYFQQRVAKGHVSTVYVP